MDITKGKTALMALAGKPARRTENQNREIAVGLLEEMQAAKAAGYGFRSISKALKIAGIKISDSVLKNHYKKLTSMQPETSQAGIQVEVLAQGENGIFTIGINYQVIHHSTEKIKTEEGIYEGMAGGKHIFIIEKNEGLKRLSISPAALKYYTITPWAK